MAYIQIIFKSEKKTVTYMWLIRKYKDYINWILQYKAPSVQRAVWKEK